MSKESCEAAGSAGGAALRMAWAERSGDDHISRQLPVFQAPIPGGDHGKG